jgi:hypothetical protein
MSQLLDADITALFQPGAEKGMQIEKNPGFRQNTFSEWDLLDHHISLPLGSQVRAIFS